MLSCDVNGTQFATIDNDMLGGDYSLKVKIEKEINYLKKRNHLQSDNPNLFPFSDKILKDQHKY
jgi:hypothetical protein